MEQITLCACYLYLIFALYGKLAYGCNENTSVLVDEMCVLYNPTESDWFEAKKTCAKNGMHLATVQSYDQVSRMITVLAPNLLFKGLNVWVGGNDFDKEGFFIWDEDHRPIVEKVWKENEPSQQTYEEDCTFVDNSRLIGDDNCKNNKAVLCMYRVPIPPNFFGPNNSFICHCAGGNCLSDGTCNGSNLLCTKGWYGPSCQFRSLSGDKYGPLGVLADNDDSTCSSTIIQPITVKLKEGSFFTEMRIVVEKPEHLGGFELYFNAFGMKMACQPMRVFKLDERTVDIICNEKPFLVDDVVISWSGTKSVCSVYIKGDQNFALMVETSLGMDVGTDSSSSLPVDGRKSLNDDCFTGMPEVGKQKWMMTLKKPRIINEIIIYRKPRTDGYTFMNGFHIRGFDDKGVMMFLYSDDGINADKSTVWLITQVNVPMKWIEIVLDKANEALYLELCEVETFGACAPPDYGLFCNQTCDVMCRGQKCHVSGKCIKCAYGQREDGECLSAEETAALKLSTTTSTSTINITSQPTEVNETTKTTVTTLTTKAITAAPLPLCTTPLGQAADNYRLVKNLVVANLILALVTVLLIIYIVYTKQENEPSDEKLKFQADLAPEEIEEETEYDDDLTTEKSDPSGTPGFSLSRTSRTSRSTKVEKSQVTLKKTGSDSTHIT